MFKEIDKHIYYLESESETLDGVFQQGFYHEDETNNLVGPFKTEKDAKYAMDFYVRNYL